jgi:transcriptional regulator with XRE-family HTH domain
MKSPITGKTMPLVKERRRMDFRKETFEIVFHYFKCEASNEQFTTTALDEVNMNQVYNQYRDRFNIPFPDEILRIRKKYNLPASRMSEVLGLGVNSYRQYEAGEMPSVANAKLIQMADQPTTFIGMLNLCSSFDEETKIKYRHKAQLLADENLKNDFDLRLKSYLMGEHLADIYSGYRNPSFEKLTEMVVFFSEKVSPFKTKMNKLLFYADFLMFKHTCFSISGLRYHAINMGPVPNNFQSIFEYLATKKEIDVQVKEFPDGNIGEKFKAQKGRPFNPTLFSEKELEILEKVTSIFKKSSTDKIINLSHLETAWKKNEKERQAISYEYAFDLSQV